MAKPQKPVKVSKKRFNTKKSTSNKQIKTRYNAKLETVDKDLQSLLHGGDSKSARFFGLEREKEVKKEQKKPSSSNAIDDSLLSQLQSMTTNKNKQD